MNFGIPQDLCGSMAQVLAADYNLLYVMIKNALTLELVLLPGADEKSSVKDQD